jgi:hypothetical protein
MKRSALAAAIAAGTMTVATSVCWAQGIPADLRGPHPGSYTKPTPDEATERRLNTTEKRQGSSQRLKEEQKIRRDSNQR